MTVRIVRGRIYTDLMVNIQSIKTYINFQFLLFLSSTQNFLTFWKRSHVFWSGIFLITWSRHSSESIFNNVNIGALFQQYVVTNADHKLSQERLVSIVVRTCSNFSEHSSLAQRVSPQWIVLPQQYTMESKLQDLSSSCSLSQLELVNLLLNLRIKLISFM